MQPFEGIWSSLFLWSHTPTAVVRCCLPVFLPSNPKLCVLDQLAMKEKMLMKLERDRVKAKNEAIEAQMKAMQVGYI